MNFSGMGTWGFQAHSTFQVFFRNEREALEKGKEIFLSPSYEKVLI